jgi:hypothetical protein
VARPGHCFQSGFRDGLLARLTHTECASPDPSQGVFDCLQETSIGLMHVNLKLRFSVRAGLVNEIALPAARSWHKGLGAASRGRQLIQLGE